MPRYVFSLHVARVICLNDCAAQSAIEELSGEIEEHAKEDLACVRPMSVPTPLPRLRRLSFDSL
jgi:hypothetical protein